MNYKLYQSEITLLKWQVYGNAEKINNFNLETFYLQVMQRKKDAHI